jgi:hypothetical protein
LRQARRQLIHRCGFHAIHAEDNFAEERGPAQFFEKMRKRRPLEIPPMARQHQRDGARRGNIDQLRFDPREMRVVQTLERADKSGLGEIAHARIPRLKEAIA